ncbi:MAG: DUF4149 domain-containing protein [Acidobacteriota bacterium]
MPNWTFLVLHFAHAMALALWVGGMVAIGMLVAPVAFAESPTPALAGRIVGSSLLRFDRLVAGCIVALGLTSVLMVRWYGRWSPWYAIEYTCLVLMSGSALYSMTVLTPRMRKLRQQRGAQDRDDDPQALQEAFDRLHRTSVLSMQFNLACGTIAILFS